MSKLKLAISVSGVGLCLAYSMAFILCVTFISASEPQPKSNVSPPYSSLSLMNKPFNNQPIPSDKILSRFAGFRNAHKPSGSGARSLGRAMRGRRVSGISRSKARSAEAPSRRSKSSKARSLRQRLQHKSSGQKMELKRFKRSASVESCNCKTQQQQQPEDSSLPDEGIPEERPSFLSRFKLGARKNKFILDLTPDASESHVTMLKNDMWRQNKGDGKKEKGSDFLGNLFGHGQNSKKYQDQSIKLSARTSSLFEPITTLLTKFGDGKSEVWIGKLVISVIDSLIKELKPIIAKLIELQDKNLGGSALKLLIPKCQSLLKTLELAKTTKQQALDSALKVSASSASKEDEKKEKDIIEKSILGETNKLLPMARTMLDKTDGNIGDKLIGSIIQLVVKIIEVIGDKVTPLLNILNNFDPINLKAPKKAIPEKLLEDKNEQEEKNSTPKRATRSVINLRVRSVRQVESEVKSTDEQSEEKTGEEEVVKEEPQVDLDLAQGSNEPPVKSPHGPESEAMNEETDHEGEGTGDEEEHDEHDTKEEEFSATAGDESSDHDGFEKSQIDDLTKGFNNLMSSITAGTHNTTPEFSARTNDPGTVVMGQLKNAAQNFAQQAVGGTGNVVGGIEEGAKSALNKIVDETKKAPSDLVEGAKSAVGGLASEAGEVAGKVAEGAGEAVKGLANVASIAIPKANDGSSDAVSEVAGTANQTIDGVKGAASGVLGGVKDLADGAGNVAKQAAEGTTNAIGGLAKETNDAVPKVADGIVNIAPELVKEASVAVKSLPEPVEKSEGRSQEGVSPKLEDSLTGSASNLVGKTVEGVGNGFDQLREAATKVGPELVGGAIKALTPSEKPAHPVDDSSDSNLDNKSRSAVASSIAAPESKTPASGDVGTTTETAADVKPTVINEEASKSIAPKPELPADTTSGSTVAPPIVATESVTKASSSIKLVEPAVEISTTKKEPKAVEPKSVNKLPPTPVEVKEPAHEKPEAKSYPLYESPIVGKLPLVCRAKMFKLKKITRRISRILQQVIANLGKMRGLTYMARNELTKRLFNIKTNADQGIMAANVGNLPALTSSVQDVGIDLKRLAARNICPRIRQVFARYRSIYRAYRKACY